ncbi:hybrid sensor histidine kinase/response regulator [Ramlibacter sp. PS4R-6]|uniref:hybrid sensor histidine kinase/response regulator n=1 Tax=Ramlibacter sp. PS4R-6 TaxID=3133438 RepID=UPI00309BBD25
MKMLRRLFARYEAYHEHGPLLLRYISVLGLIMLPVMYLLRPTRSPGAYDDLALRAVDCALLLGLMARKHWPERIKGAYLAYSYLVITACLPFTFIFTSLKNGGGAGAVANTFMAVFLVLLLADWRNMVVMLVAGAGAAVLGYFATTPGARIPADYIARLPLLIGTIIGASLFKYALEQATAERVRHAYASLAGSIAHEMRNPLGRIRHNLECMQEALPQPTTLNDPQLLDAGRTDALYRLVAESEVAVKRGLQVIAMTLDEVGAKPIDRAGFALLSAADTTRKALQEYAFQGDDEAARVDVRVTADFVFRGDETAYVFVIFNLIKNALYYLPAYPHARVTITVGDQQVKVHDDGPGIPYDVQERLFQPFASAGKTGGTGLGLAYCRRVMEAFGGTIRCESVPQKYTEFSLAFPQVPPAEVQALQQRAMEKARAAFAGKRLLLVDDDAAQRTTSRHKLQALGVEIDQATDGQRALEALARTPYDIVLLDLNMPLLDGYAVARSVRQGQVPLNRDVAIVAHTSEPAHIAALKARRAGMDAFVGKPSTQAQLIEALSEALQARIATQASVERRLTGRRILVADDAAYNRKTVAAYLRHVGVTVVQASHGEAVLQALRAGGGWDAIVLDINMPGMDGLQTAAAIRQLDPPLRDVPIIALTAHSDDETLRAAQATGMNGFITKPVDAAVLYKTLGELVSDTPAPQPLLRRTEGSAAVPDADALLNPSRLESYARIGMLGELLGEYVPELTALAGKLQRHAQLQDMPACADVLHSLLGMSGEAGAPALYQAVRRVYVPMVEAKAWPVQDDWAGRIAALAAETVQALNAYGAAQGARHE